ncbi:hypothetical protein [Streptomyces sp. NPDC001068]|uniref:hypothetical protein n=1 Tax=Streptomyces sp. NPDC001068 TaxID=3364544 RepID=UPI0036A72F5C
MTVSISAAGQSRQQDDLYDWAIHATDTWRVEYRQAGHGEADADTLTEIQGALYRAARGGCAHRRQALRVLATAMGRTGRTAVDAVLPEVPRIEADLAVARAARTS